MSEQIPCIYCGSKKHEYTKCSIMLKAQLLVAGADVAFDHVIEVDTLEDAANQVAKVANEITRKQNQHHYY